MKFTAFFFGMILSLHVHADLEINSLFGGFRPYLSDIYYRGTCEQVNSLHFNLYGDHFSQASEEEPVYVRIRLSHGVTLCETKVDLSQRETNQPIPLALQIDFSPGSVHAHPDSISIMRWKQGEHSIWLKVISSSSQWLQVNDQWVLPSAEHVVFWRINQDINVDASTSQLTIVHPDNILHVQVDAFDHQTQGVEYAINSSDILLGDSYGFPIWGYLDLAKANNLVDAVPALGSGNLLILLGTVGFLALYFSRKNRKTGSS